MFEERGPGELWENCLCPIMRGRSKRLSLRGTRYGVAEILGQRGKPALIPVERFSWRAFRIDKVAVEAAAKQVYDLGSLLHAGIALCRRPAPAHDLDTLG